MIFHQMQSVERKTPANPGRLPWHECKWILCKVAGSYDLHKDESITAL